MLIDWFTMGAQVVNFLILVLLLKKFLYGPITQAIAAREAKIQALSVEAETRRQEAAAGAAAVQQRLQELEDKHQALAADLEAEVARQRKDRLAAARQEVEEYRQGWLQSLSREQAAWARSVQERCSRQAVAAAGLILRELSGVSLEERCLQVFLDRLATLAPGDDEAFRESLRQSGGAALVVSALPLDEDHRSAIKAALQARFGTKVTLQFQTDPGLITGIEVKTGSRKLGWTASGALQTLEEDILSNLSPTASEAGYER